MLRIEINDDEFFDDDKQEFIKHEPYVMRLQHSLVSLSKWEEIFEKPFLNDKPKAESEILEYIKCMSLDDELSTEIIERLTDEHLEKINTYINAKMTATWFSKFAKKERASEIITSEVVYYWMFSFGIPKECEHWHLNKLLTLIQVFSAKNSPPEKLTQAEIIARNRELNAARRAELGTKG